MPRVCETPFEQDPDRINPREVVPRKIGHDLQTVRIHASEQFVGQADCDLCLRVVGHRGAHFDSWIPHVSTVNGWDAHVDSGIRARGTFASVRSVSVVRRSARCDSIPP